MCVEKNERATDNKIKTRVQNILGGLVLGAIPGVAIALIVGWSDIRTLYLHNDQRKRDTNELSKRIDRLEAWRDETNNNRFRAADGLRLLQKIDRIETDQRSHEKSAQGWIEVIKRNTDIVLENQKKSHRHPYDVREK